MSSNLQSLLEQVVLNNYLTLVVITAVVYDYVLTFSREIEYIWCKPWTRVSAMFVVIRYIGLCWVVTSALPGSTFVPGPLEVSTVVTLLSSWTFVPFFLAADLVMILRVYALWNRSKAILYILLFIFLVQTIINIVYTGIYVNPNTHLSVTVVRVFDISFCNVSSVNGPPTRGLYIALVVLPGLLLAATLLIFAVFQTVKQSVELYKATKQWQPNRYVQQLVSDGIIYFALNALYQILHDVVLNDIGVPTTNASFILLTLGYILVLTLIPRFTIGIRELYDRDIRGRFHIDTGFGVLSQPNLDTTVSAVVFGVNQGLEVEGDIEMGDRVHESGLNEDTPAGGSGV
ncbi:hypothetical protein EV363DRAFT_1196273 [Boletus edulis]|nr:hypothetical protein EV363DRAFT_1196273 [Boletus edulis]